MKEVTMFQMKRSASGDVVKKFEFLINLVPLPVDECLKAIIFFFVDDDVNRSWVKYINSLKEKFISTHDEPILVLSAKARRRFLEDLSAQSMKKFTYEVDPSSRLLLMGAGKIDNTTNFEMRYPDCLLTNFQDAGVYGCIDGVPRSGKTSLATTFMQILGERFNFQVITNIAIDKPPDYIHIVNKLSDFAIKMDAIKKRWIAILDETGTFVGRKRALSKENIDFENLTRFIGKMGGRLIMITHSFEMDVPSILQSWITEKYTKKSLTTMYASLSGNHFKMHRLIDHIPKEELKMRTEDITSLDFDISIKKLLQDVQNDISIDNAVKAQLSTKQKSGLTIRAKVEELLKAGGLTHKQIAKKVGTTRSYVTEINTF